MKLEIIAVYENLEGYLFEMEKDDADYEELWDRYAIRPYWEKISQWAPFDMSERKPKPIKDICKLKQQIKLLKEMNLDAIRNEFSHVVEMLPNYDDDTIVVAIYPFDDENTAVKEQQNGIQGVNVFGNILIQINPFAKDYFEWIPYVFAHEYHHFKLLYETDFDYVKYMFGNEELGIPRCAGYFFGYKIIDSFRKLYPKISIKNMLEMNSEEIFSMSNYHL